MAIRPCLGLAAEWNFGIGFCFCSQTGPSTAVRLGRWCAAAVSRVLQSRLFAVSAFDPLVLALAVVCVRLPALAARLRRARPAALIEPIEAWRAD